MQLIANSIWLVLQLIANFIWTVLQLIANSIWEFVHLIANFIKQGVPLKESLVFALKRKREGSRSSLLLGNCRCDSRYSPSGFLSSSTAESFKSRHSPLLGRCKDALILCAFGAILCPGNFRHVQALPRFRVWGSTSGIAVELARKAIPLGEPQSYYGA